MLLPDPVGATDNTSRPSSIAYTTAAGPGRNASRRKTSRSVRSALSITSRESDGIPWRGHASLPGDWEVMSNSAPAIRPMGVNRKTHQEKSHAQVHLPSVHGRVQGAAPGVARDAQPDRRLREVPGGAQ